MTQLYGVSVAIWDGITQRYLPPDTSEHTRFNPGQTGWQWHSIYLPRRDGRLSWVDLGIGWRWWSSAWPAECLLFVGLSVCLSLSNKKKQVITTFSVYFNVSNFAATSMVNKVVCVLTLYNNSVPFHIFRTVWASYPEVESWPLRFLNHGTRRRRRRVQHHFEILIYWWNRRL